MSDWIDPKIKTPTTGGYVFVLFTSKDLGDCCGKPPVTQVGIGEFEFGEWWVDPQDASFKERSDKVHGWMPIDWPEVPA